MVNDSFEYWKKMIVRLLNNVGSVGSSVDEGFAIQNIQTHLKFIFLQEKKLEKRSDRIWYDMKQMEKDNKYI